MPCLVRFRKTVNPAANEKIEICAEGEAICLIDGIRQPARSAYRVPAGVHELECVVFNTTGMCALFVQGDSIVSDESWHATMCLKPSAPLAAVRIRKSCRVITPYRFAA